MTATLTMSQPGSHIFSSRIGLNRSLATVAWSATNTYTNTCKSGFTEAIGRQGTHPARSLVPGSLQQYFCCRIGGAPYAVGKLGIGDEEGGDAAGVQQ